MNIETTEFGTLAIIAIMTVVTIITRWGGIYVMSYIPISQRVQQFIAAMSGSVLVAIIAPLFITGDIGAKVALLVTAIGTLVLKRPLLSITFGILLAALTRSL
ncbi:AzlD domain-containing protein [Vibrio sp. Isolate25]|uniref:AzlD family protein n=1 Tax=Vibrio TaxID=662 RepID=UPI001EFD1F02|nr:MULTISPECIES: AzlD domain-containing protein [Vibrio]MCG9597487.1 AzlD domain-containing protein [Vibrio sp. Isolate25]MCG9678911.1 AzlD domain-containing protein [Vibrio sp. Isolate24]MCG9682918.1 AzlD domain-containing protein [Vibrio sp. Isolate23]USD31221.1 AzlD domain-containing protein [Vibrio sp. SCSIO 43186]USD44266.1 AzlD domain-containing protein [Vibrio sp. SCSIO 43145]